MTERTLSVGELVRLPGGEVGVVSRPITDGGDGHVLTYRDGGLAGVDVSMDDLEPASLDDEGYAQLAYALIKLGSHVIESKLLVYGK